MVRLTRAQQQERTQRTVLAAAEREFAERGYDAAKVDRIAERVELTRGAVYSNFPSKRALYLAVLLESLERINSDELPVASPASSAEALGAFARAWLERIPLSVDTPASSQLQQRSLSGVLDESGRIAMAQVTQFEALLLGLVLEAYLPRRARGRRRVRLAELVLTMLSGSGHLAEMAAGFGDPFDVVRACEHLAGIDLADTWDPPHLPYTAPAQPRREPWAPPTHLVDELTGSTVALDGDGVIAVLGSSRLSATEEATRTARPSDRVTVVVVTSNPAEIGRLVRLGIGDLTGCLRRVFAPGVWPGLRVVVDDHAEVAAALGLRDVNDATEAAVRIRDGEVVAAADGRGAVYAAASAGASDATRNRGSRT